MRLAIRQQLIDSISELEGRVYEPHEPGANTDKPFAVVRQGAETEDTPWSGFRRIFEVWPHVSPETFSEVDSLANQIAAALDKQLLTDPVTGEVFSCLYQGTAGQDHVDEVLGALTRGLRFAVVALQPVNVQETVPDDLWLEALATWTEEVLGQEWTVYRGVWPAGYVRPAVMWRLAAIEADPLKGAMFEIRKRFVGHAIGRTPNEQADAVLLIVERLGDRVKIPLLPEDHRYLTIAEPRADLQADAVTGGQITVTLARRTGRPAEESPLIMGIHHTGQLG